MPRPSKIAVASGDGRLFASRLSAGAGLSTAIDKTGWAIQGPEPWNVTRAAVFRFEQPRIGRRPRRAGPSGSSRNTAAITRWAGSGCSSARPCTTTGPSAVRRQDHLTHKFNDWLSRGIGRAPRWTLLRPRCGHERRADVEDSARRIGIIQRRSDEARRLPPHAGQRPPAGHRAAARGPA